MRDFNYEERKRIDMGVFYGDYRKLRSKLGWRPKASLRQGPTQTIAYY